MCLTFGKGRLLHRWWYVLPSGVVEISLTYVVFVLPLAALAIQCLDLFISTVIKAEVYIISRSKELGGVRKKQAKIQDCLE